MKIFKGIGSGSIVAVGLWLMAQAGLGEVPIGWSAPELYRQGANLYSQGDSRGALEYAQAATAKDPNLWQAFQLAGYAAYKLGDFSSAADLCGKSLALNPGNTSLQAFVDKIPSSSSNPATVASTTQDPTGVPDPSASTEGPGSTNLPKPVGHFELGLGGDLAIIMANFYPDTLDLGFGGYLKGIYMIDPQLGVGFMTGFYSFGKTETSPFTYTDLNYIYVQGVRTANMHMETFEIMPVLKGKFGQGPTKVYFLGGIGLCVMATGSSASYAYTGGTPLYYPYTNSEYSEENVWVMAQAGVGFEAPLGPGVGFYMEARYSEIFLSQDYYTDKVVYTIPYSPLSAGLNFSF